MKVPVLKIRDMKGQSGKVPVLKVGKAGQDLRIAEDKDMALNSLLFLPKVYAVVRPNLVVPSGQISNRYEYTHNLGYPPMYMCFKAQDYLQDYEEYTQFSPQRYYHDIYGGSKLMDNTKYIDDIGNTSNQRNSYLVLFLDALNSRFKDFAIDSRYQTLKVHMQGQFSFNTTSFVASAVGEGTWFKIDWFSFDHNLGYPPVHTPFSGWFGIDVMGIYAGSVPSTILLNEAGDSWSENVNMSYVPQSETYWIYVDKDKYYIGCKRENSDDTPFTFPARTVRVNYTIFNLPINEEFNLLT